MYEINEYYDSFVKITKLSSKKMKQHLNWFKNQNILVQNDVFSEQKNYYFKLKSDGVSVDLLSTCSFYLALKKLNDQNRLNSKNKTHKLDIRKSYKKISKVTPKEKREKLLNLWSVIQDLKYEGYSYRKISKYLKSKHRFEVSHSYISEIWKEVEDD